MDDPDRRRGYGEGSVYQQADGLWRGTIEVGRDSNGKRRRRVVAAKTKSHVLAKMALMAEQAEVEVVRELAALERERDAIAANDYVIHTVDEAAERLRITKPTLYKVMDAEGGIRTIRAGRRRLIPEVEIRKWIDRQLADD